MAVRTEAELLAQVLDRAGDLRTSLSQLQNDQHLGRQWPDLLDQYTVLAAKLHSFNTSIHASFSDTTAIPVLKEEIDRVPLILRTKVLPEVEDAERALLPGWENEAVAEAALSDLKTAQTEADQAAKASDLALTSLRQAHTLAPRQRGSESGSSSVASQAMLISGLLLGQGLREGNVTSEEQLKQALARIQAAARSAAAAASTASAGAASNSSSASSSVVGLKRGVPAGVPMAGGARPKLATNAMNTMSKPAAPTAMGTAVSSTVPNAGVPGVSMGGSATVISASSVTAIPGSTSANPTSSMNASNLNSTHASPSLMAGVASTAAKPSAYAPPPRTAMGSVVPSPASAMTGSAVRTGVGVGATNAMPNQIANNTAKPVARSMYAPPPQPMAGVTAHPPHPSHVPSHATHAPGAAITAKPPPMMVMSGHTTHTSHTSHSAATSVNPAALINQNPPSSMSVPKAIPMNLSMPPSNPLAVRTGLPPGTLTPNMLHAPFKQG